MTICWKLDTRSVPFALLYVQITFDLVNDYCPYHFKDKDVLVDEVYSKLYYLNLASINFSEMALPIIGKK